MKNLSRIMIAGGLLAPALSTPAILSSCSMNKEGSFAFMFKATGNHYGELLYDGFTYYMENKVEPAQKHYDKSPSEANVGEQIQMIETLILQKVKGIVLSAAGTTGYDNVLKKAHDNGIPVISVDSPVSPKYRLVHVDHCDTVEIGEWQALAAILIALREPYPYGDPTVGTDNPNLQGLYDYVKGKCANYNGTKKKFGYISSTADSPSQNDWMESCTAYLKKDDFANVVDSSNFEIKYGLDDPTASKTQAEAFITSKSVDVIICPTTVALLGCGQALSQTMEQGGTDIRMTGIGLPSEMKQYMPKAEDIESDPTKQFDYPCPFMTIWNVRMFGELAAYVMMQAISGGYKGEDKEVLPYYEGSDGNGYTLITQQTDEGTKWDGTPSTKIIALKPLSICAQNLEKWLFL